MKFTPEQVIEMAREADPEHFYPDEKLFDDEVAFLERLCTLAADRALEAAQAVVQANALACEPGSITQVYLGSNAAAIRAMKEHK